MSTEAPPDSPAFATLELAGEAVALESDTERSLAHVVALANAASGQVAKIFVAPGEHVGDLVLGFTGEAPPSGSLLVDRPAKWIGPTHLFNWDQTFYRLAQILSGPDEQWPTVRGDVRIEGSWLRVQGLHITGDLVVAEECRGVFINDCIIDGDLDIRSTGVHVVVRTTVAGQMTSRADAASLIEVPPPSTPAPPRRRPGARRLDSSSRTLRVHAGNPPKGDADFRSVSDALQAAKPGDRIVLEPGVHADDERLLSGPAGSDGVLITTAKPDAVTITGTWYLGCQGVTLRGLTFRYVQIHALVLAERARHNTIERCRFIRGSSAPLLLQNPLYILGPDAAFNLIRKNTFDGQLSTAEVGKHIFRGGSNTIGIQLADGRRNVYNWIRRNDFRGFFYGTQLGHGSYRDHQGLCIVTGNHFHHCKDGIHIKTGSNVIRGNTSSDNVSRGIMVRGGSENQLTRNTVRDNGNFGICVTGPRHLIRGNTIAGNRRGGVTTGMAGRSNHYAACRNVRIEDNIFACAPGSPPIQVHVAPEAVALLGNRFSEGQAISAPVSSDDTYDTES